MASSTLSEIIEVESVENYRFCVDTLKEVCTDSATLPMDRINAVKVLKTMTVDKVVGDKNEGGMRGAVGVFDLGKLLEFVAEQKKLEPPRQAIDVTPI